MLPRPAKSSGATPGSGLLIEGASSGEWNMAVDEVLLHLAAETQGAYLRFYRWSEPTLSLGYFQPYAQRRRHKSSRCCAVVRRTTGGAGGAGSATPATSSLSPRMFSRAGFRRGSVKNSEAGT